MGFQRMMRRTRNEAVRRSLACLLSVAVLAGIVHLPGAPAMACRMDEPVAAPAPTCGACGAGSEPTNVPSLEAGSCCRFAAPEEVSSLPEWTQSSQRAIAGAELQALALTTGSPSEIGAHTNRSTLAPDRSTAPPGNQSLSTHLRL